MRRSTTSLSGRGHPTPLLASRATRHRPRRGAADRRHTQSSRHPPTLSARPRPRLSSTTYPAAPRMPTSPSTAASLAAHRPPLESTEPFTAADPNTSPRSRSAKRISSRTAFSPMPAIRAISRRLSPRSFIERRAAPPWRRCFSRRCAACHRRRRRAAAPKNTPPNHPRWPACAAPAPPGRPPPPPEQPAAPPSSLHYDPCRTR